MKLTIISVRMVRTLQVTSCCIGHHERQETELTIMGIWIAVIYMISIAVFRWE